MKYRMLIFTMLILCISIVDAYAEFSAQDLLEVADDAYKAREYGKSATCYQLMLVPLEKDKSRNAETISYVRYRLGRAQIMQGSPDKAVGNIKDFYQRHPGNPYVVRNYALALYYDKQYSQSIPVFEKAAALKKEFKPEALCYIGSAKLASGNIDEGRKDLIKVGELSPQSNEAKIAGEMLAMMEKTLKEVAGMDKQAAVTAVPGRPTKEKPWAVSLTMGLEYDTNVGLIPSEQTRPSDISSTNDWRAVYSLAGVYEFINTGKHFAGMNLGVYGTNQFRDSMFDVESGVASFYYKTNLTDTLQFRISPFASKTWLTGAPHNWSYGTSTGVSYQPVQWTWTDLNGSFSKVEFTDNPEYPQENRNSKNYNAAMKQNFRFDSLLLNKMVTYFGAWVFCGRSNSEGASYSNNNWGMGVQTQQEFPWDFTILLSYGYGRYAYENANIRSTTNDKRDDSNHTVSANIFKKLPMILKNLSAYAGWRWYKNDSNIPRYYSYSSGTYSMGVVLDF